MARFYHWTHDYMDGLDMDTFNAYYLAIEPIRAAEQLSLAHIVSFPHLAKREDQSKFIRSLTKLADSVIEKEKDDRQPISTKDLAIILGARG
jgi:hypothetical protein